MSQSAIATLALFLGKADSKEQSSLVVQVFFPLNAHST
jgi:hypothetical protein